VVGPPALNGTASATWNDGTTSLTSTGGIVFQKNGAGGFGAGPTSISNADTIDVIWDPAAITAAANNAVLTGTLTNGTNTNTYTITVTRAPASIATLFTDLTLQPLSTAQTSNVGTPTGFNVPVTLTLAGATTNPLTAIQVAVAGGGFASSPVTVNPGNTLQLKGTTGAAISTDYGVDISLGAGPAATATWLVGTVAALPSVAQPSVLTPANNATGVGTATGLTLTSGTYTASNGAGLQDKSEWEVYANSHPLISTNAITGVTQNSPSWTQASLPGIAGTVTVNGMAAGNGVFVTVGGNSNPTQSLLYSVNGGVTWNVRTTAPGTGNYPFYDVIYAGGKFVVAPNFGQTATSTDGQNWTGGTFGNTFQYTKIGYGGGTYLATRLATTNQLASSTDGLNWSAITTQSSAPGWDSIYYGNGKFIVTASSGTGMQYSTDSGASWTLSSLPVYFYSIVYAQGKFVANSISGSNSVVYTSSDGLTWTSGTTLTQAVSKIFYNGSSFWGISSTDIFFSSDAVTWTSTPLGAGVIPYLSAYDNGYYVTGASGSSVWSSNNTTGNTVLAIAGCQSDGFLVNDTVVSAPAAAGPGVISAVSNASVTVFPSDSNWAIGQNISRATSMYTAVTGSPFTVNTGTLTSLDIAKPPLVANTPYYARVRYTSLALVATSDWSGWSKFTTGDLQPSGSNYVAINTGLSMSERSMTTDGTFLTINGSTTISAFSIINSSVTTTDDGANWTTQSTPWRDNERNGVVQYIPSSGRWVAAGGNIPSASGGQVVSAASLGAATGTLLGATVYLGPQIAYNGSQVFAVGLRASDGMGGYKGQYYYSTNGGSTFTLATTVGSGDNTNGAGVVYDSGSSTWYWAIANAIYKSTSLTGPWTNVWNAPNIYSSPTTARLQAFQQFPDGKFCIPYLFSNDGGVTHIGALLTSTDGTTWTGTSRPAGNVNAQYTNIASIGSATFVCNVNTGKLHRSLDNGSTWTEQSTPGSLAQLLVVNNVLYGLPIANGTDIIKFTN
jgi:hypothetical protein